MMWRWFVELFGSHYQPLDRPAPLSASCGGALDSPMLKPAREIQHAADNVIAGVRGKRDLQRRRDRFTEGMRDAWAGPVSDADGSRC